MMLILLIISAPSNYVNKISHRAHIHTYTHNDTHKTHIRTYTHTHKSVAIPYKVGNRAS